MYVTNSGSFVTVCDLIFMKHSVCIKCMEMLCVEASSISLLSSSPDFGDVARKSPKSPRRPRHPLGLLKIMKVHVLYVHTASYIHVYACDTCVRMRGTVIGELVH